MNGNLDEINKIFDMMTQDGLPSKFIKDAAWIWLHGDTIYDLLVEWREEGDGEERKKIVGYIQKLSDECLSSTWTWGGIADKCRSQTLAKETTNTTDSILKLAGMKLSQDAGGGGCGE